MGAALHVAIDLKALDRESSKLQARLNKISLSIVPQAEARALNKAGADCTTQTRRDLSRAKQLPQRRLKERIKLFRAFPKKLSARVWIGLFARIRVDTLPGARYVKNGASAGMLRAGKLSVKAFRATMPNGKAGFFVRVPPGLRRSKSRPMSSPPNLPIDRPFVALQPEAENILFSHGRRVMNSIYPRELSRLLIRAAQQKGAI
mgnify:CR=1 FL=1